MIRAALVVVAFLTAACSAQTQTQPSVSAPEHHSLPNVVRPSASPASRHTVRPASPHTPKARNWDLHVVARASFHVGTRIQILRHRVFGDVAGDLEALSLTTGRVVHRRTVPGTIENLAVLDGRLWVSVREHHDLDLYGYTSALRPVSHVRLAAAAVGDVPIGLLAAEDGVNRILVADGATVIAVAVPAHGGALRVAAVDFADPPGVVDDIAWLGASRRVSIAHRGARGGRVSVYRLSHGSARLKATLELGTAQVSVGDPQGITASPSRVYVVTSTGNADGVDTYTLSRGRLTFAGGVGYYGELLADRGEHQLVIGAVDRLICADPRTGEEAASSPLTTVDRAGIATLALRGEEVVAVATTGRRKSALITARPPAACRRQSADRSSSTIV